jgi:hypothetical protein
MENWESLRHQKATENIASKLQMIVKWIQPVNVHTLNLEKATSIGDLLGRYNTMKIITLNCSRMLPWSNFVPFLV